MVQQWILILLKSFSISAPERQLIYCQMYHSDVPFTAQFQQVSHLDQRQCKC
jgi:hypothetical protein